MSFFLFVLTTKVNTHSDIAFVSYICVKVPLQNMLHTLRKNCLRKKGTVELKCRGANTAGWGRVPLSLR